MYNKITLVLYLFATWCLIYACHLSAHHLTTMEMNCHYIYSRHTNSTPLINSSLCNTAYNFYSCWYSTSNLCNIKLSKMHIVRQLAVVWPHKPAFSRSSLVLHQKNEYQENQQYSWFCHSTVLDRCYLKSHTASDFSKS